MDKQNHQDRNLTLRLRWLILLRALVITFLLGTDALIEVTLGGVMEGMEKIHPILYQPMRSLVIISATLILSLFYLVSARLRPNVRFNIYFQGICDTTAVTALVFVTGGVESVYSLFYTLIIIYCVLFLGRRGGLIMASFGGISYGLLLDLAYYEIINPLTTSVVQVYYSSGYVLTRIFVHIISLYMVALIASYFVEREQKATSLLAEKETAFENLDLLHRSIIESVPAGIVTVNLQGQIKTFNRAAEEITGLSQLEVYNRQLDLIIPGCHDLDTLYSSDSKIQKEIDFISKDKKKINLVVSLSPLYDRKKMKIGEILIFQDITARKLMEEDFERSKRFAFLGEMASGLAHEIRNPLAALSGSIQLLKKNPFLTHTDKRLMEIIIHGKEQIESFLQDFLLLARPAPGCVEECDMKDIIEEVIDSLRVMPDWHEGIEIKTNFTSAYRIRAKKNDIRQVVWNLALNALQSMPEGGKLTVETKVVKDNLHSNFGLIRISDTGTGIEESDLKRVFEPFYTKKEKGTGLGLAIVHRIVTWYGGTITLESRPAYGTTVLVRFPPSLMVTEVS